MLSPRPLKFCMLTTYYPPYHFGGDAVFVRRLSHALALRGHTVDVIHDLDAFAMGHAGTLPEPLPEPDGVRVHRLRSRLGRLSCLATQQVGRPVFHQRRLRRILGERPFDVIHFHNVSLIGGPGLLAYGNGIKLYTAHEHWLVCPTHTLWRHNREVCESRQCLSCVLRHRRPPQYWRYTGLIESKARHIDAFISPSHFSARLHKQFDFNQPITVIPHFVPDADSDECPVETATGNPHVRPYFLFVGRLEKMKGLQDVLPHFSGAAPADLLIAGAGSYEATLRATASGVAAIRFLGRLTSEQLRPLYRNALAVVIPSIGYETFGMVTLEAFRERTPVIARAVGPLTEIVSQSGGGLLFHDSNQLAQALHQIAADSLLRQKLAAAGHRSLKQRWSERVVLRRYLELIRSVACRKGLFHVRDALDAAVLNAQDDESKAKVSQSADTTAYRADPALVSACKER